MSKYPIIVFEGIEGSGKSLHIKNIERYFKKKRVKYWEYGGLVGQASVQIFFEDPCGNMIELQED